MVGAYSDCGEEGGQMGYLNDLQKILEIKPLDKKYSEKFSDTQDTPSNQLHIVVRRDASDATEHAKSKLGNKASMKGYNKIIQRSRRSQKQVKITQLNAFLGHHDLPASAFQIDNMMRGANGKAKRSQKPLPDSAFEIQNMMRGSGNITY